MARSKHPKIIALLITLMLVLTGCGVGVFSYSELYSNLEINDQSGTREFKIIIPDDDIKSAKVDVQAMDDAISEAEPEEMSYDGMKKVEDGIELRFTISFDDFEEYETKLKALLELADYEEEAEKLIPDSLTTYQEKTPFISKLIVREKFVATAYIKWALNAALEAGITNDRSFANSWNELDRWSHTLKLSVDGKDLSEELGPYPRAYEVETTSGDPFDGVQAAYVLDNSGAWTVATYYYAPSDKLGLTPKQKDYLDELIDEVEAIDGVSVSEQDPAELTEPEADGEGLAYDAPDLDTANQVMQILLHNKGALKVDGAFGTVKVKGTEFKCLFQCESSGNSQTVKFYPPETWDQEGERVTFEGPKFSEEFDVPLQIDTFNAEISLGSRNSAQSPAEMMISFAPDLELDEESIEQVRAEFEPEEIEGAQLEVSSNGESFDLRISADSPEELEEKLNSYLSGDPDGQGGFSFEAINQSGGLFPSYLIYGIFTGLWWKFDGVPEDQRTVSIKLPALQSMDKAGADNVESSNGGMKLIDAQEYFTVSVSGPGTTAFVLAGIVMLFLIAIVLLIIFRKHIFGALTRGAGSWPQNGYPTMMPPPPAPPMHPTGNPTGPMGPNGGYMGQGHSTTVAGETPPPSWPVPPPPPPPEPTDEDPSDH